MEQGRRGILGAVLATGLMNGLGACAAPAESATLENGEEPGRLTRILVKFKGVTPQANGPATSALALPAQAHAAIAAIQGRVDRSYGPQGVVRILTPMAPGAAIESLQRSGTVEYAEPDGVQRIE